MPAETDIDSIIFDLSEVLLPGLIGVELLLEASTGIPADKIARAMGSYPHFATDNQLDMLLKGRLTHEAYRARVLGELGLAEGHAPTFDAACLSMFREPYAHTHALLERTSRRCELFLLSDHCEPWARHIMARHDFFRHFKDILWSFDIGETKKKPLAFETAISRFGVRPESCLFVDDNLTNINNAAAHRFRTVHFTGERSIGEIYGLIGVQGSN